MLVIHICTVLALTCQGQSPSSARAEEPGAVVRSPVTTLAPEARRSATRPADENGPSANEMGLWLVDLARHQGHLVGRADPRSASLHVIALLEAARQVAPDCPETYYWLYDLLFRMEKTDPAREALARYVQLAPTDETARIRLMEMELDRRQTAEERAEYLKSELEPPNLPRAYASELHRRLAEYHFQRRETEEAGKEVEQALRLNSMNVPARRLAYTIFGETEPALQRVEMALQLISINPSQANVVWDLGEFLDQLSLHRQAQEWYNRAIDLHRRADNKPAPAEYWYKLALSYSRSEDWNEAKDAADAALKIDENLHLARLLRAAVLEKLGKHEEAASDNDFVAKAYQARIDEVAEKKLLGEAAEIAWFYCYHQPNKDRAFRLAGLAMEEPNPSSLARLAYGYALRMNGDTDEAMKVLEPLAATDQLAALELAKAHIERGDKARAVTILHKAATIQYSGIAHGLIRDLLAKYGETAAEPPMQSKIIAALEKFHRDVFDFHQRPGDFLKLSLSFASQPLPPTGPVNVLFRLENVGAFPITFGEGYMVRPLLALSAKIGGDGGAEFKNYLQVMLNSKPVLLPGDAIEKTLSIDVGPVQEYLIRRTSRPLEVELTALFDPVHESDALSLGPGTIECGPVKAVRNGVEIGSSEIAAMLDRAGSPIAAMRIQAGESIAALLAEIDQAGPNSEIARLPREAMSTALAGLLADHDWRVRARALAAAAWLRLDDRTTNAAAQAVRDQESAVVKMLAVRLFAQQHGAKFKAVLEQFSKTDPNPCVRMMARSFLPEAVGAQANKSATRAEEALP